MAAGILIGFVYKTDKRDASSLSVHSGACEESPSLVPLLKVKPIGKGWLCGFVCAGTRRESSPRLMPLSEISERMPSCVLPFGGLL